MDGKVVKLENGETPLVNGNPASPDVGKTLKFDEPEKDSIVSLSCSVSVEEDKPKFPDGGWGWVVVLSSLVISMIADGISFSFGLLYIEFLQEFGASKSVTSWIGSLFMAVPLLTGPIMSALVDHYGCRAMTIAGGIVSAFGFILSTFAQSITVMYLTFGVIAGLGLGLCYVTAVVSIAFWFDKKRGLAVGLGACGTGIGTFVYAPMTQFFITEFGWRGTVLLLSGTFLNMCVCGAVMRDPDWMIKEEQSKSLKKATSTGTISGVSEFPGADEIRKVLMNGEKPEYILQNLVTSSEDPIRRERFRSDVNLPTFVQQNETVPLEVLEQLSSKNRVYNVIVNNYPNLLTSHCASDKVVDKMAEDAVAVIAARTPVRMSMKVKKARKVSLPNKIKRLTRHASLPEEDEDLESATEKKSQEPSLGLKRRNTVLAMKTCGPHARHYIKNNRVHRNSVMYRGGMVNIPKNRSRAASCPHVYANSVVPLPKESEAKWYTDVVEILKTIVDFSLYLELHFLLLSISTILLYVWFVVPYFYLAEHLTRHGYTESEASVVLSIIGITNTIGMIALGWAGDQPWLHVTKTYAVCLLLCGLSCASIIIFTDNYVMLSISSASFGLFFSSNYSLTPAILVELISLDNFTNAYGLILLNEGIGNLIGPPLAGLIFDLTGTWDQSFIQAGVWIIISGVLIGLIPFTQNRKLWKNKK